MSAKYTYHAWQMTLSDPADKLLLLLLSDQANEEGLITLCLSKVCHLCAMSEIGMANRLTSLAEQGILELVGRNRYGQDEYQIFRLLIATSSSEAEPLREHSAAISPALAEATPLPVYSMREPRAYQGSPSGGQPAFIGGKKSEGNTLSTYELDENVIPDWAERAFRFSGIANEHLVVWRNFVLHHKARANELMTISRIESKLQNWLTTEKRYERQTNRSATAGDAGKAQGARYQQKLSPSERFRQQVIQKGHTPKF